MLNELKGRKEAIKDQKLIKREALTDGTMETLLDGERNGFSLSPKTDVRNGRGVYPNSCSNERFFSFPLRNRVELRTFSSRSFSLDLKRKPYLRADAARRNRHKTHELMKQIHRDAHTGVNNGTTSEVHF